MSSSSAQQTAAAVNPSAEPLHAIEVQFVIPMKKDGTRRPRATLTMLDNSLRPMPQMPVVLDINEEQDLLWHISNKYPPVKRVIAAFAFNSVSRPDDECKNDIRYAANQLWYLRYQCEFGIRIGLPVTMPQTQHDIRVADDTVMEILAVGPDPHSNQRGVLKTDDGTKGFGAGKNFLTWLSK